MLHDATKTREDLSALRLTYASHKAMYVYAGLNDQKPSITSKQSHILTIQNLKMKNRNKLFINVPKIFVWP